MTATSILWKLLAPKPVKRAGRNVRRATHPVRTASWALSPTPVKKMRRAAFKVAHPGAALEAAASDQVVRTLRGSTRGRRRAAPVARAAPRVTGVQSVDVLWLAGATEIPVAGTAHHGAAVEESVRGVPDGGLLDAVLIGEPGNPHDANAVGVYLLGGHVGYLPRRAAAVLKPGLAALSAAHGGLQAGCPARVDLGGHEPRIVLLIDLTELRIDPAALESGQA